jgi:hypothetical protein
VKLIIRGYEPLIIPKEAFVPMKGSFGGNTPYIAKVAARWKEKSYIQKKLPLKILCLESIYDRAVTERPYKSYSDPLAGIGISARIFGYRKKLYLNDFDESCCKVLRRNYDALTVTSRDVLTTKLSPADLIFLDFNDFTMKRCLDKYQGVMARAFEAAGKFLVINDCSLFYLRYGAVAFDVYSKLLDANIGSVTDYLFALKPWYQNHGWHLIQANYFSETSFLLLSRKNAYLKIEDMRKAEIPPGMIRVEKD